LRDLSSFLAIISKSEVYVLRRHCAQDYILYAEFNRYFVKKLKKAQNSSKSNEMTFLQPKQTMNSLLGVKIAQNPYF